MVDGEKGTRGRLKLVAKRRNSSRRKPNGVGIGGIKARSVGWVKGCSGPEPHFIFMQLLISVEGQHSLSNSSSLSSLARNPLLAGVRCIYACELGYVHVYSHERASAGMNLHQNQCVHTHTRIQAGVAGN